MPADFLKTFNSITNFSKVMVRLKRGMVADANIELTRDECRALVWGLQMLATGDVVRRGGEDAQA